jgi:hypothetical protein
MPGLAPGIFVSIEVSSERPDVVKDRDNSGL